MLTANVSKSRKVSSPLPNITFILNSLSKNGNTFFWMDFYVTYFTVTFTKTFFLKRLCEHAWKCLNILRRKCPLHGTTHLYSYTIIEKFRRKNSRKIQQSLKVINEVEDEIEVCGTYSSKDIVQLVFRAES